MSFLGLSLTWQLYSKALPIIIQFPADLSFIKKKYYYLVPKVPIDDPFANSVTPELFLVFTEVNERGLTTYGSAYPKEVCLLKISRYN